MKLKRDDISQKNIWIMIVGAIIILLTITILRNKSQAIVLKNKSLTLEYGELLSMEITDYLDLDQTKKEMISDIKMDTSAIIYENGKDYPAIGNYKIILSYKNEKATLQLYVKDTIAPVFKDFITEVEFMKGSNHQMKN
ncbi:MAG: hypothetical protein ACLSBH_16345 [Coprobacillus cateniformis]